MTLRRGEHVRDRGTLVDQFFQGRQRRDSGLAGKRLARAVIRIPRTDDLHPRHVAQVRPVYTRDSPTANEGDAHGLRHS